ncbi:hypothetical protein MNBD_GAMMA26-1455 [hydrothermal vent metagenome]|uniref:Uncharacterized protein n=1 Tax=hydrothermal vent metagenome TaxID=652676 RepID=A0A3B1BZ56_9ZZZZ
MTSPKSGNTTKAEQPPPADASLPLSNEPQAPLLQIRDDLLYSLQEEADGTIYIIEDPVISRFFRIGKREYSLLLQFDGRQTPAQALENANECLGADSLSNEEASQIAQWLATENLLVMQGMDNLQRMQAAKKKSDQIRFMRKLNPIFIKLPLINPNRLLAALLPYLHWMLGKKFFVIWSLIVLGGLYQIAAHGDRFAQASQGILYPHNWLWLGLTWITLKTIHEIFHGLVSKKYGGDLYEAGVILILFMPIGYVDATSSWRFNGRWPRIHTAAAGMFIELFLAGIAAWVWAYSDDGVVADIAYNTIFIAGISTLLFNANPLMRFDGYFIFSDLLGIPNLYTRGSSYISYLGRRYIIGLNIRFPHWSPVKDTLIKLYGVLALLWRLIVIIVILIAAYHLFYGAGVILTATGIAVMAGIPAWRLGKFLLQGAGSIKPSLPTFFMRLGILCTAIYLVLQAHWAQNLMVPAVVDFTNMAVVRAQSPGFVRQIHVTDTQLVAQGEVLLELENHELTLELKTLNLELEQAKTKGRIYLKGGLQAAYQIEQQNIQNLHSRLEEKGRQVDELIIYAPQAGQILTRHLDAQIGSYLGVGTEILKIADSREKEVQISIGEDDMHELASLIGQSLELRLDGAGNQILAVEVERITPRASREVLHPMLTALNGGPLVVRPKSSEPSSQELAESTTAYELLKPRFNITSRLSSEESRQLWAGETATAKIPGRERTIGNHIYVAISRWVERLSDQARWD